MQNHRGRENRSLPRAAGEAGSTGGGRLLKAGPGVSTWLLVTVLVCLFMVSSHGQILTHLPMSVSALCMKDVEGTVWVGTAAGLYREAGSGLQRVGRFDKAIWRIIPLAGHIWLITTRGVACLVGEEIIPLDLPFVDVTRMALVGDSVWLFTQDDTWEVTHDFRCRKILDRNAYFDKQVQQGNTVWLIRYGLKICSTIRRIANRPWSNVTCLTDVADVEVMGPRTWLATTNGLVEMMNGQVARRFLAGQRIYWLFRQREDLWVATGSSLYRWRSGKLQRIATDDRLPGVPQRMEDEIWISTDFSTFVIDGRGRFHRLPELDDAFYRVMPIRRGVVCVKDHPGPAWIWTHGQLRELPEVKRREGVFLQRTDHQLWFTGEEGIFVLGDQVIPLRCPARTDVRAVSAGPQGIWLIHDEGVFILREGACRRFPDQPLKVMDMIQTPSAAWMLTRTGDLYRLTGEHVLCLSEPLPIGENDSIPGVRFVGKVTKVALKEDSADRITFELTLDLAFRNESSVPVFLVNGEPIMSPWEYWVSGAYLAASPERAAKRQYLIHDSGVWPNNYRGTKYLAFRNGLDQPAPTGECVRTLAPGGAFSFQTVTSLSIEKKEGRRFADIGILWKEIRREQPLWFQTAIEVWPINLDYSYDRMLSSTVDHGVFRAMLQRRWFSSGRLAPTEMMSEPMALDLSPWRLTP